MVERPMTWKAGVRFQSNPKIQEKLLVSEKLMSNWEK